MFLWPTHSELLGYISILCWICAQIPQLLENIRNQSCDGLALPFLANWALGDLSNLIGCILTHQLPFQTYLASYFCFVDFSLVGQYIYYSYIHPRPRAAYPPRTLRKAPSTIRGLSVDRGAPHYRTLSAVAANIAATAALAAHQEDHPDPRYARGRGALRSASQVHGPSSSVSWDDEADESALAAMTESFHSEDGWRSRRKYISWSSERRSGRGGSVGRNLNRIGVPAHGDMSLEEPLSSERGRSLERAAPQPELGRRVTSSRASHRGAGMIFFAVWALFSIGTLTGTNRSSASTTTNLGRVLIRAEVGTTYIPSLPLPGDSTRQPLIPANLERGDHREHPPYPPREGTERIIGRIFAWLCTTLYLTSRLPQIWKNYVRKSVEGLSMYLFVFAFLGNTFYVASILSSPQFSSPPPQSTAFIRESLPYLLGSAGTLTFDITIVTQSFIYSHKRSHRHSMRGRRGVSRATMHEEEAGLLSGDALPESTESPGKPKQRASTSSTRM